MTTKVAKASTKKNVVALNPDVQTQIEALRKDITLLADAVKIQAKETVSDTTATVKSVATEKADVAKDKYNELTTKAETRIKDNPLTSIAIAVGAGLLLGAITRR